MADILISLDVTWNGTRLVAKPTFGAAWRDLVGPLPEPRAHVSTVCSGPESLTQFELGLFLAEACRIFTNAWVEEEPELVAASANNKARRPAIRPPRR